MTSKEILEKFIKFYEARGHKQIPNVSLIPENDPSVLFTTAGMHPLVPYLMGEVHPLGKRLVNVQKCVRTDDIEEVGDTIHCTFFEMLGYWSLGDFFKKEALEGSFEFLTRIIGLDPKRMYVTVYKGDSKTPQDLDSVKIWKGIFSKLKMNSEVFDEKFPKKPARIFLLEKKENWWGPVGDSGPCGPDSEIFYWRGEEEPDFTEHGPWDDSGMFTELGNNVFIEFNQGADKSLTPLLQKNVDFGGGLERISLVSQFKRRDGSVPMEFSVYNTDLYEPIYSQVKNRAVNKSEAHIRVILDHIRSVIFILADGIVPGNKDQGYVVRRLIRRIVRFEKTVNLGGSSYILELAKFFINKMKDRYPHLGKEEETIFDFIRSEIQRFDVTLGKGGKIVKKMLSGVSRSDPSQLGKLAFDVYQSMGYPQEIFLEDLKENGVRVDSFEFMKTFNAIFDEHQAKSRSGAEQKFKGGLADQNENTVRYHTATHLLHAGLRKVLGEHVSQQGSNITGERLRFDFSHSQKLSDSEIEKIEKFMNDAVDKKLPVNFSIMNFSDAEKTGALHFFGEKYGDKVKVYYVGESLDKAVSKEFCGGPHVENTSEIGHLKIFKQEKIGEGKMRVYVRFEM